MIGRRAFLALGVAGVAGLAVWRVDIPPRPIPDERDEALLAEALEDQREVLALVMGAGLPAERVALVREQFEALGGDAEGVVASGAGAQGWAAAVALAADRRAAQTVRARAQDLVETLAAVTAGLRQLATVGELGR